VSVPLVAAGIVEGMLGDEEDASSDAALCPRCGRDLGSTGNTGFLPGVPRNPKELCSYCLTGRGPGYVEPIEPHGAIGRWLWRRRFVHWVLGETGRRD
jgi:hypothetical protein